MRILRASSVNSQCRIVKEESTEIHRNRFPFPMTVDITEVDNVELQ